MRTSYQQQISTLEAQAAELQRALNDARSSQPLRASPRRINLAPELTELASVMGPRVKELEAANAALERALLDVHDTRIQGSMIDRHIPGSDALLQQARVALAERDAEVGSLKAEIEILHKQRGAALVCLLASFAALLFGVFDPCSTITLEGGIITRFAEHGSRYACLGASWYCV
jgi:chromosome segregation ATPase